MAHVKTRKRTNSNEAVKCGEILVAEPSPYSRCEQQDPRKQLEQSYRGLLGELLACAFEHLVGTCAAYVPSTTILPQQLRQTPTIVHP